MPDHAAPSTATQSRVVRVFVSSTFRDMQAEREELIKRVFPQLRKLCEKRGVTWGEVDLRWGVTDEQKAEGKVLPICLAEIHNCRPYFIGLLGERYGWVPDEIAPSLVERESWLSEQLGRSVTELEVLHGVLNNPQMAEHAFFYFRSPSYLDTLPAELQAVFREVPALEETQQFGAEGARRRAEERKHKLDALKQRIRGSQFPVREGYPDPQTLAELVLRDLTEVIDRVFPEGSRPPPLDLEAAEHAAFAASRARVYIGRQEYFDALDAHARGDGPPLVVLGESGSGKSALLANWAVRYGASHPSELLLLHFVGATPASADWAAMVRRILGELDRRLGVHQEIPDQPEALRAAFANALHMAAARGRVVLILDALNQLEDRDQAPDVVWLPPQIPPNLRLVVSALPGRALDELTRRGWPTLPVQPLEADERSRLIVGYLAQYTKTLSPARVQRIATASQTANPLYLRALLEELRVWGDHLTLDQRIEHYLSATTVDLLYQRILGRYEEDFQRERPGLVGEAMALLWAARRGLSQVELLDLLGSNGQPLPAAHWSPLYLAAEQSLVSRSGVIGFFHDYLRQAVRDKYLAAAEHQQAAHVRLADYFEGRDLGPRQVQELPWQLSQATSWPRLYALLGNLAFFDKAWDDNQFDVKAYWAQVEANSESRLLEAYRPVLDAPTSHRAQAWNVASLLDDTGHPEESLTLWEYLAEYYRTTGDSAYLQATLGHQALIFDAHGDYDRAMTLNQETERLCRELGDKAGLQASLGRQALILAARGDLDGAMALNQEGERLGFELGNKDGLAFSLANQAVILVGRGYLDKALPLYREVERLCRELGQKDGLRIALASQALILGVRGDLDQAMRLHQEEERLCRELGDKNGLRSCLGGQGLILAARGDLDGALALHREAERLARELGSKDGLIFSLGNQALVLAARGDLDGALALHKEEERLCRELGDKYGLQVSLGNQALILKTRGDLDGAMALHKEEERLCREMGSKDGLRVSLNNQALILTARGDLDGAIALQEEAERLSRELSNQN